MKYSRLLVYKNQCYMATIMKLHVSKSWQNHITNAGAQITSVQLYVLFNFSLNMLLTFSFVLVLMKCSNHCTFQR